MSYFSSLLDCIKVSEIAMNKQIQRRKKEERKIESMVSNMNKFVKKTVSKDVKKEVEDQRFFYVSISFYYQFTWIQ
jgi:hypothetical protein